jgi:hypothetical protein
MQASFAVNLLKYFFIARLLQLLLTQNESEQEWKRALQHQKIGENGNFFRFNVEFDKKEPSLDNIEDLAYLGQIARESIHNSPELIRLAHCIRAELFFFELSQKPRLLNGVYDCTGYLICRLPQGTPGFTALMDRLDEESATFKMGSRCLSGDMGSNTTTGDGVYWRRMIKFQVSGRRTLFSVTLTEGPLGDIPISGSPFTIDWLVRAQRLDAVFGSSDHRPISVTAFDSIANPRKRKLLCDFDSLPNKIPKEIQI